jgi:hypothetical protein
MATSTTTPVQLAPSQDAWCRAAEEVAKRPAVPLAGSLADLGNVLIARHRQIIPRA